jgi:large subunit ribosomal protein L9
MKVILQQNVQKLGKAGDVVEAAPGYFRNFLQPRSLAVLATEGTMRKREEDLEGLRKKAEQAHQVNVDLGDKIKNLGSIVITAKAGEAGKLYGKVTTKEIAAALKEKLGTDVDKRLIKADEEIGTLGHHHVIVKLSPEVHVELDVEVVTQGGTGSHSAPAAPAEPATDEAVTA